MEIANLKAEPRKSGGTREARRVRRTGQLPAIIYGHNQEPESVSVPVDEFVYLLSHGGHVLSLDMGGSSQQVLIKDVQYNYLGDEVVHVDFARVDLSETVHVSVPIEFRGTPVGILDGGTLEHEMVDLEIECRVNEIPGSIRVNVTDMKLGDVMHVRELPLPPGMKAVSPAESLVCSVRANTAATEIGEATEEGAAEGPEIIGRDKTEEEGGGE